MENGIFFSIISLFYVILILVLFLRKDKIKTKENTIYMWLILFTLLGLLTELGPTTLILRGYVPSSKLVIDIFLKLILIFILFWTVVFSFYIVSISSQSEKRKKVWYSAIGTPYTVAAICVLFLDVSYYSEGRIAYSYGPAVDFIFVMTMILYLLCTGSVILNYRKVKLKKYLPLLIILPAGAIVLVIQAFYRGLTLIYSLQAFITVLMFFTLENPDLKLLSTMRSAKDLAEKNSRAKSDFLSSMSYEIRTPLNAIVGLSEDNIKYLENVPDEVSENCKDIVKASHVLLDIVTNIIDINKIETNTMEVVDAVYNFKDEMTKISEHYKKEVKPEVVFNLDFDENIPYEVIGDKDKVKNIVDNLLSNAVKYTEKGLVSLSIKCNNDMEINVSKITINCKDTGKGIKPELQNRIFNKFDRLDDDNELTGAGLGLAVTKALVEMMGGSIHVHSMYGQGSEFIIEIPQRISKLTHDSEQIVNNQNLTTNDKNSNLYEGKRILLVDDNALNIKVSRKALEGYGFIIEECHDGNECLDLINNGSSYDLIFMDIMMNNMNGDFTLHKLRENQNFDTPVIALTADAATGSREKYLFVGFDEYVAKPFTREQLKEKIDAVLSKKVDSGVTDWDNAPSFTIDGDKTSFSNIDEGDRYDESYLLSNGIDYKKTVSLLGDISIYKQELKKWRNESKDNFDRLKTFKLDPDLTNYENCVRILMQDAKYYGFDKLEELATIHEAKAKENDIEFVSNNFGSLENEHIRIARIVDKYLK